MHMKHYAAMLLAGISVIAFQGSSRAANEPALKGEVRSAEEGPMGGVTVTATRDKSTVAVTAITDDRGRYGFPADRLVPVRRCRCRCPKWTGSCGRAGPRRAGWPRPWCC